MLNEVADLISILTLHFPTSPPPNIDQISAIFNPIRFPAVQSNFLNQINIELPCKNVIQESLKGTEFYFPLVPDLLHLIANCTNTSIECKDYCACFVLCSYISWRLYVEMTGNFDHLPIFLRTFPYVSQSSHSELVIRIYIESILFYLDSTENVNLNYILPSFKLLFPYFLELGNIVFPILHSLQNHTQYREQYTNKFLQFISNATQDNNNISADHCSKIINLLDFKYKLLDVDVLRLYSNISKSIPTDLIESMSHKLPELLVDSIQSVDPIIVLPPINSNDQNNSVESEPDNETNDFYLDEPISFDPVVTGSLFNEQLNHQLEFSAKICSSNEQAVFDSLKEFNSSIYSETNSKHGYDILYAFIVFVSHISMTLAQAELFWNTIMRSRVFSFDFFLNEENDRIKYFFPFQV